MATTKRSKGGRAAASRSKTTARPRATGGKAKATPTKKVAARVVKKAKPAAKAKAAPAKRPAPARAASPKRAAAKPTRAPAKPVRPAGAEHPEAVALKARFQRERNGFEKRLTEAVREIGLLRHHEIRAMQFERQLAERDATIGRLQTQLTELERRPATLVYEREVQQTFALGTPAYELDESAAERDELEDEELEDNGDLVTDEE